MNRKFVMVAAGAVLAVGSTLASAVPASAATQGTRPCPSGGYCFYNNAGYGLDPALNNPNQPNWHLNYNATSGGSFNNPPASSGDRRSQLSSVINNGNRTICIWDVRAGRRDVFILRVAPYQDLRYVGDSANDRADKWKVFSGSTGC